MATAGGTPFLVFRLGEKLGALPISDVDETMRPLPIEPLASAADGVLGLAVIRGAPTPVLDAGRLIAGTAKPHARFIVVRVGERRVALAVEDVLGVRALEVASLRALPPLLANGERSALGALATLDSDLLLVLEGARLVPEAVETALESVKDDS